MKLLTPPQSSKQLVLRDVDHHHAGGQGGTVEQNVHILLSANLTEHGSRTALFHFAVTRRLYGVGAHSLLAFTGSLPGTGLTR
jgi:hypothetical protein